MKVFVVGGVTCRREDRRFEDELSRVIAACGKIGSSIAAEGHSLVVCSPFPESADFSVLSGIADSPRANETVVEFHFVDNQQVREQLDSVVSNLNLKKVILVPHSPPKEENENGMKFAWLLCQLHALESCHVAVALGGKPDGAANMLLQFADGRQKPLLPLRFLGGAAAFAFDRRRYELEDKLGKEICALHDESSACQVVSLAAVLHSNHVAHRMPGEPRPRQDFFISYSRARQAEADHVEALLRRRNVPITRDESDFGAGHSIPAEIKDAIYRCTVFIVMWCKEYACSPWCHDEFELALDRHASGSLHLWIFCLDETRMIPKRARNLNSMVIRSRQELEGNVTRLLLNYLDTN